jgi:hypothetical protein
MPAAADSAVNNARRLMLGMVDPHPFDQQWPTGYPYFREHPLSDAA